MLKPENLKKQEEELEAEYLRLNKTQNLPKGFNPDTYLELNPDVALVKADPIKHYLEFGIKEGRKYKIIQKNLHEFQNYLSQYSNDPPDDQNAFDLFFNSWSSKIPNIDNTGIFDGFNDIRISWMIDQLGGVDEYSVLELGPLEAAHTWMLERAGAKVTAIEGNFGAFLRCLLVKNKFNLKSKFVLGDFSKFDSTSGQYDLVVASGVLYHMADPVSLLSSLSKCSQNLYLWTHYFEEDLDQWSPALREQINSGKWDLENVEVKKIMDTEVKIVRQNYREALSWNGFCGGKEIYSYWIFKQDLLALLRQLGFKKIHINFDQVDHQNGPAFALLASK
jgi:hypothetical protein